MRMWMIPVEILCTKHLLGEHVETHMFVGTILRGKRLNGYVDNNLFEARSLQIRHDKLANEIDRRGYKHKSDLKKFDIERLSDKERESVVDVSRSFEDLLGRCEECRKRNEKVIHFL